MQKIMMQPKGEDSDLDFSEDVKIPFKIEKCKSRKSQLSLKSQQKKRSTTLTQEQKAELARLDLENMRPDKTRRRKTKQEVEYLESEYLKDPDWSYELKCRIALRLRMSAT